MKKQKIRQYQDTILRALAGRIDEFYLVGGTALSLFYFQHRMSVDLDFFTDTFARRRIEEIIRYLQHSLKKKIELVGQNTGDKESKILIYYVYFNNKDILKIDFVEDMLELLKPTKVMEGIRILSLEDIYLRKLCAVSGAISRIDKIGRKEFLGGRVDSKDFYDLYFLSHTFMNISKFIEKYGTQVMTEGLIRWFMTYGRMEMMDGVLTLDVDKKIDYKKIEEHFKQEIDKIIESQIEEI